MKDILVDSSVWIDFFNGNKNTTTERLASVVGSSANIFICPPILQEVLQGFKSDADYNLAAFHLESTIRIEADAYQSAQGAAQLFRTLRKKGITIRKGSDCLIAWYALQSGCAVLHRDRDFDLMAKPLSLKVLN